MCHMLGDTFVPLKNEEYTKITIWIFSRHSDSSRLSVSKGYNPVTH
jgi:hypothetical protein